MVKLKFMIAKSGRINPSTKTMGYSATCWRLLMLRRTLE